MRTDPNGSNDVRLGDRECLSCSRNRCRGGPSCGGSARRGAAVPRRHGSRVLAARARGREAGASLPDVLCAERDGHGVLDAERGRQRLRAFADSRAAGAYRNQMLVLSGIKANWNYIHAGRLRVVSHGHDARRTKRSGDHRRRVDGPAARPAIRQGDAGGVARAVDGRAGQRRRVHRQS